MASSSTDPMTSPRDDLLDGFPSPRMPQRVMVRAYRTYAAGARAIERLERECGISAARVTLVARGLEPSAVDARACIIEGGRRGSIIGAVCSLVLVLSGVVAADVGVVLPSVSGVLFGALTGAAVRLFDGHDCGIAAEHYDVLVDEEVAAQARHALTA
jgi:glyceraldehyde-3-phosphate dehydrogenase/erythrose-4-phosphate dehydrogenase